MPLPVGAAAILLLFLLVLLAVPPSTGNRKQPNIIIALVDDLGWSDVGYHKASGIKTPHIDKLATQGIILTNHYVQPLCSPSRASLLTGKYPIHIGAGLNENVFAPDEPIGLPLSETLLPEQLKDVGYATALFGKWHLGFAKNDSLPTRRGFDKFFGFYSGAIDYYSHNQTAHRCHRMNQLANYLDFRDQEDISRDRTGEYSAGIFNQEALKFIRNHQKPKPFFMLMSYQNVHDPLQVPDKYSRMYPDIVDKDRRIYAGMSSYLDESVRNLTEVLKETGMWDDTLIVFMSDNGGNPSSAGYNWPLKGAKGTLWEGGIRSASFLSGGYLRKSGFESHALVHVTDWYPTLLNLAQQGMPGRDTSTEKDQNIVDTVLTRNLSMLLRGKRIKFDRRNLVDLSTIETNRETKNRSKTRHSMYKSRNGGGSSRNMNLHYGSKTRKHQSVASRNGDQSVASRNGDQTVASRNGDQTVAYRNGNQTVTSRNGNRTVASRNGDQTVVSRNGDQSVASRNGKARRIDGLDVWKAITNKDVESPRNVIIHNINNHSYAIRRGNWKLITEIDMGWIEPPEGSLKTINNLKDRPLDPKDFTGYLLDPKLPRIQNGLYDISKDSSEENNCSKQHPEIVEELLAIINKFKKTIVPFQRVYTCNLEAVDNAKDDNAWGPFLD